MDYYLSRLRGKSLTPPMTSVITEDKELISRLKAAGFRTEMDWEPDYLYFVLDI